MKESYPAESICGYQFRHPALQQGGIKKIRPAHDQIHTKLQIIRQARHMIGRISVTFTDDRVLNGRRQSGSDYSAMKIHM